MIVERAGTFSLYDEVLSYSACDDSGQNIVFLSKNGHIFMSRDFGATLNQTSAPVEDWISVTMDATGRYIAAAAFNGYLYTSEDYGASWVPREGKKPWQSIAGDSSGAFLVAAYDPVYVSYDYGITWQQLVLNTPSSVVVACSGDGSMVISLSATDDAFINFSRDKGETWITAFEAGRALWTSASITYDGQYITVLSNYGAVASSSDNAASWRLIIDSCPPGTGLTSGFATCSDCPEYTYNDGTFLECEACPLFTVSQKGSSECLNPCPYPYVPDHNHFEESVQCTAIDLQFPNFVGLLFLLIVSFLYVVNVSVLYRSIAKLRSNVKLLLFVAFYTAIPVLDFLSDFLFIMYTTMYNRAVFIASIFFIVHLFLSIAHDMYHQRHSPQWHPRLIVPINVQQHDLHPYWKGVAYFMTPLKALVNLIWMVPMILVLFCLYSTKLYAFETFAGTWHGLWSGDYRRPASTNHDNHGHKSLLKTPVSYSVLSRDEDGAEITGDDGKDTSEDRPLLNESVNGVVVDVRFFNQQNFVAVVCESLPQFIVQLYNTLMLGVVDKVVILTGDVLYGSLERRLSHGILSLVAASKVRRYAAYT